MVPVVVVNQDIPDLSHLLEPAFCSFEPGKCRPDLFVRYAHFMGRSAGSKGIQHVVFARYGKHDPACPLSVPVKCV